MSNRPKTKSKIQYGDSPTTGKSAPSSPKMGSGTGGGPMGAKIAIGAAVVAVLIAIIVFAVADGGGDDQNNVAFQRVTVTGTSLAALPSDGSADPAIGSTIPTLTGKSFDGSAVEIKPGEPMIVTFVAHWCPHCQAEVPKIVEWQNEGQIDDIKIYGVSTSAEEAKGNFPPASWLEAQDWKNDTLVDDPTSKALQSYGATSFPTLVAVKADGTVALRLSGELTLAQFQSLVDAANGKAVTETPTTDDSLSSPVPTSAP